MASIIDSARNITEDTWWFPKMLVLCCFCYAVYNYAQTPGADSKQLYSLIIISVILFFGIGSFLINAIINNTYPVIPGLANIFAVIRNALITPLLFFPGCVFGYFTFNIIKDFIPSAEPFVYYVTGIIIFLLFLPFAIIPVILFSVKNKITDALNITIIVKSAGNFIVSILTFIIQYVLTIAVLYLLFYFLVKNMFGFNEVTTSILYSFFTILSVLLFFSYCAMLYGNGILETDALDKKGRYELKERRNRNRSRRNAS